MRQIEASPVGKLRLSSPSRGGELVQPTLGRGSPRGPSSQMECSISCDLARPIINGWRNQVRCPLLQEDNKYVVIDRLLKWRLFCFSQPAWFMLRDWGSSRRSGRMSSRGARSFTAISDSCGRQDHNANLVQVQGLHILRHADHVHAHYSLADARRSRDGHRTNHQYAAATDLISEDQSCP
jgi:hypothetical protein